LHERAQLTVVEGSQQPPHAPERTASHHALEEQRSGSGEVYARRIDVPKQAPDVVWERSLHRDILAE
jgi:hypothetical protein